MPDTTSAPDEAQQETPKTFADFGVHPQICEALAQAGITSPFPIQELTLPLALAGADLIGQARTGTGKTFAFGIPLLQRVDTGVRKTQALVVVPTRELCLQVAEDLAQAGAKLDLQVVAVYGGKALEPQAKAVEQGAQVVVGTPGRLLDLLRRGSLTLSSVTGLVLDEADEMLDLGFLPDVEQLIEATAEGRQTLLFSATMPSAVVALARRYMHKPTFLRADIEEVHVAPKTTQHFFSCHRMDKPAVLARILTTPDRGLCVVFTRTKRMADVLAEELRERGVKAAPIHSDLRQEAREKALQRFRKGTIDVLVATEVAARGLDIDDVTHVVNYDCPDDEKMYLHRIGRTGRAGAAGVAITMAVWNELARLEMIKKALDIDVPTHEVFSTSPILDELFDLPPRGQARADELDEDFDEAPAEVAETTEGSAQTTADRGTDSGEAPRKRRRRGGRGRGRGAQAGSDGDTAERPEHDADPTPASPSGAPAASDEDGTAVRRRTRRRTTAGGQVAAGQVSEAEPAEGEDRAAAPAGGEERVRVRRRVRGATGTRPENGSGQAAPARDRVADAGVKRREPGRTGGGTGGERPGKSERSSGTDHAGSTTRSRTRAGGGRPSTSGGRGGAARERDAGVRRGASTRTRERRVPVDPDAARGAGKPGIVRPLRIAHLP